MDAQEDLLKKVLDEVAQLVIENLPGIQDVVLQAFDLVFIPKAIIKQWAVLVALETGLVTLKQISGLVHAVLTNFNPKARKIRQLEQEQSQATTQEEWMDLAEQIDQIQGNDLWRTDPNCPLYERDRINARIDELVHLMHRRDLFELMFVLRGSIGRNKFGLLHRGLFTKAKAGTKILVETYHNVVCAALDYVCDAVQKVEQSPFEDTPIIPSDARLAFFNETRHAYGRTALLCSGGGALGIYHFGVVKCLLENSLMPRVIGGSSAGSIVAATIGTRTDSEIQNDLFQCKGSDAPGHTGSVRLDFFRPLILSAAYERAQRTTAQPLTATTQNMTLYDKVASLVHDVKRIFQGFVPISLRCFTSILYDVLTGNCRPQDILKSDNDHLRKVIQTNVGNFTFQEAFDRTGRILNIVVTPSNKSDPPRLLNYLTAPHVMVWSAALASASLPGVFESNRIVVKEADGWERYESTGEQTFWDGSMEQDLPMEQLSEMFNVNHFIVSQVNPHAVMFASYNHESNVWSNPIIGLVDSILGFLKDQLRSWVRNLIELIGGRRIAPLFETQRGLMSTFFTQEYEGRPCDVSLVPWRGHRTLLGALTHIIYNLSFEEFPSWILAGERETWRVLPAIKSHIAEEITLDRCVQRLRKRLIREAWEKQKQQATTSTTPATSSISTSDRVPSFFTSPSLVNLSGLAISDQPHQIDTLPEAGRRPIATTEPTRTVTTTTELKPGIDVINFGWNGHGLHGNRSSSNNLRKSTSYSSGVFIDEEHARPTEQTPGESTANNNKKSGGDNKEEHIGQSDDASFNHGYVKTTSMARFYYRKISSHGSAPNLRQQQHPAAGPDATLPQLDDEKMDHFPASSNMTHAERETVSTRPKSLSHGDLEAKPFQ